MIPTVAARPDIVNLSMGRYRARIGTSSDLSAAALGLRRTSFRPAGVSDQDPFDAISLHGVVSDTRRERPVVAFRVRVIEDPAQVVSTYTGGSYDLAPLKTVIGPFVEMGRICQDTRDAEPMPLRLAWAALTVLVDRHNATLMFGCATFPGAEPEQHAAALGYLGQHHVGPPELRPRRASPHAVSLPTAPADPAQVPPLLFSYLKMGGWVSDHAVRDPDLETVHIFTGLQIAQIPAKRQHRLRQLAQSALLDP